jgi:small subunit ribosomal protein S17
MAATATATPPAAAKRKARRSIVGRVVAANRTPKTLKVEVGYLWRHPKYGKYLRRSSRLTVHDEKSEARQGDQVEITECRPISKTKSWRLVKIVSKAPQD